MPPATEGAWMRDCARKSAAARLRLPDAQIRWTGFGVVGEFLTATPIRPPGGTCRGRRPVGEQGFVGSVGCRMMSRVSVDGYRLGVDLGTSTTVAVLSSLARAVTPLVFDGSELLASAVCLDATAETLLVGRDATHASRAFPGGFEPNPKRRVDDGAVLLGDTEVPVVDLLAATLRRVATEAERTAGSMPAEVILACPAGWGARRRHVLLAAATAAGLGPSKLVSEPVAAAAYFVEMAGAGIDIGRHAVIYDLGAGTFDAAVVRRTDAGFELLANRGLTDAGGLDIDAAVIAHLGTTYARRDTAMWRRLTHPTTPDDRRAARQLWDDVRAGKEMLSRTTSTVIHVPLFDDEALVVRDELEQLARPILQRTVQSTSDALDDAGVPPEAVAGLFLVGGASRMPSVATLLHRGLGIAPTALERPELVVAHGSVLVPPGAVLDSTPRKTADSNAPAVGSATGAPAAEEGQSTSTAAAAVDGSPTPSPAHTAPQPLAPVRPVAHRRLLIPLGLLMLFVIAAVAADTNAWRPSSPATHASTGTSAPSASTSPSRSAASGPARTLVGHTSAVKRVSFSQDGGTLVSTANNGGPRFERNPADDTRLWDVGTGRQIGAPFADYTGSEAELTPDGRTLITVSASFHDSDTGVVEFWDVAGHRPIGTIDTGLPTISDIAVDPDGTTLAVSSNLNNQVRLWDIPSRKQLGAPFTGHTNGVMCLAFSPDGKTLAAGGGDETLRLWDVASRRSIGSPLVGHTGSVLVVAFSPNGQLLATGGEDGKVRLWNAQTRQAIGTPLVGHPYIVYALAFHPDSNLLASVGDGILLWSATTGQQVGTRLPGRNTVAFSPDGQTMASDDASSIRIWTVAEIR